MDTLIHTQGNLHIL